tara:strand:+ start:86 stop:628 length:543 start_codon:yes stop_codon:yes gene_type:complete
MSKSPVKFVGAAARTISGGSRGGYNTSNILADPRYAGVFGNKREDKRQRRAQQAKARADYRKNATMSYRDRMRAGGIQAQSVTAPVEELSSVAPTIKTNNSVDNTLAAAPIVAPAALDPISRQPIVEDQPIPPTGIDLQPQVPTYGVADAAEAMFGTPMQRQMSMGSSLMKRACKYKNKK